MVRRKGFVFLGVGALTGVLAVWSSLIGCQGSSSTGTTGGGGSGGGSGGAGSTTTSSTNSGSPTSTATGAGGGSTSGTSTGAGGGGMAVDATISDITTGKVKGITVKVTGVVVTSKKFLVSQSKKSGSCLWGLFISEPGLAETTANSGILAVSYGMPASIVDGGAATCTPETDKFPVGTAPGDVLDIVGLADKFGQTKLDMTNCAKPGESKIQQFQLSTISSATKTGTAPLPKPHALTAAEITSLGGPTDQAFFDAWGGVKVAADNVSATTPDGGSTGVVGAFGVITLDGSGIGVADKLYYKKGSSAVCDTAPSYAAPMVPFTEIDGFVYLDFCTWHLAPSNKCADFKPISEDCMGNAALCN